jgi:hypothetical protein
MIEFLYWSGVAAWSACAWYGALMIVDRALSWLIEDLWTKREFIAFVADRLKRKARPAPANDGDGA